MRIHLRKYLHLIYVQVVIAIFCTGCSSSDPSSSNSPTDRFPSQQAEYIYRKNNESLFDLTNPVKTEKIIYPWDKENSSQLMTLTKEFFRCKGNSLNPCHIVTINHETRYHHDCSGKQQHGLPLRDGKEFIYPILIDLMNYIQLQTHQRVVITSGHRCPEHNAYVDGSKDNQSSKHMIGAEVSFYVHSMENTPEIIVRYLQEFYQYEPTYKNNKDFQEFYRYEKSSEIVTPPWFNKEIFIKLYKKNEGRNFDNRHPYPYISIQVRYDRDLNEKVSYSWEKANRNYHRS